MGLCFYENRQFRRAMIHFERCRKLDPNLDYIYSNIGCAFEKLNERQAAIRNYKKALSLNPVSGQTLFNLGNMYYQVHKYKEAVSYLEKCYYLKHSVGEIVDRLAHCYFKTGQLGKEIALYQDWLQTHPSDTWSLNNLGVALMQAGEFNRAQLYLRKAATIVPKDKLVVRNFKKVQSIRQRLLTPSSS